MRAHSSVGECGSDQLVMGSQISLGEASITHVHTGPRPPPLPPPHGIEANPDLRVGWEFFTWGLYGRPQNRSLLSEWSLWGDVPAGLPQQVWSDKTAGGTC